MSSGWPHRSVILLQEGLAELTNDIVHVPDWPSSTTLRFETKRILLNVVRTWRQEDALETIGIVRNLPQLGANHAQANKLTTRSSLMLDVRDPSK